MHWRWNLSDATGSFQYALESDPLSPYKVTAQVRRNDLYEQYVVSLKSGVQLSLKSVSRRFAPRQEPLAAIVEPFSVGLLGLHDFGTGEKDDLVIVTELAGTTLRDRLDTAGALPPAQALDYLTDMARALRTLEERELPMPTIYPAAVSLRQDGVRLDDYFLPLLFDHQRLPLNFFLAAYSAPELDQGGPSSKSTLFSLGVVLFEMLTGRAPFAGSVYQVIAAIRTSDADLSAAPEVTRPILARLLARDPRQRYASLGEFLKAVDAGPDGLGSGIWLAGSPGSGSAETPVEPQAGPAFEELGPNEAGRPEFRRPTDGAIMVLVPAGSYDIEFEPGMPSPGETGTRRITVPLEPFLIDKFPVTWEQFVAAHEGHDRDCDFCSIRHRILPSRFMPTPFRARDPHDLTEIERQQARLNDAISADGGETLPASYLTWKEMGSFAEAVGAELPSEAEWEYANRAGSRARYPWGDDISVAHAWYADNSGGIPHPVGRRKPNAWGVHDMNGNVMEACRDRFVKQIYDIVASGATSVEQWAEGVTTQMPRYLVRGGGFSSDAGGITSAYRVGAATDIRSEARGFRCVIRRKHAPDWAANAVAPA